MGRLFKRGKTYYADLRPEGGGKFSLHTKDAKVAKARLRAAELGEADNAPNAEKRLDRAIDDMLSLKRDQTAQSYRAKSLHLIRVLGAGTDINRLTRADASDYIKVRREEGAAPHTIHKELVALRQTLKEAQRRGEYHGSLDVVPKFSAEYEPRTRWLTQDEFAALLAATPVEHRSWLMIQVYTSANKSETERIGWEHVDFEQGWVRVPGRKRSTRWRRVPLHPTLARFLEGLDRSKPLVAPWPRVNHELYDLCESVGIARVSTNDLRRTFGAWLKQAGADSLPVAHMMGHSSTLMVERVYGRLSEDTYRDTIARLPSEKPAAVRRPKCGPPARKVRK